MDNYYYIVAGLPVLSENFEPQDFSYEIIREHIYHFLSDKDRILVTCLEKSFDTKNLSKEFYNEVKLIKNTFIKKYIDLDHQIRNIQVKFISEEMDKETDVSTKVSDPEKYLVDKIDIWSEFYKEVQNILLIENVLEREQKIDAYRWNKAETFTQFDFFNINAILSFLVKAKIVERWNKIDKEKGTQLFENFINEIQSTYKEKL